jgi:3-deoxy-D-manno-octulosonic-acid transferase
MIYNTAITIFQQTVNIAAAFNSKAKQLSEGQHQTFEILAKKIDPQAEYIWLHAASLGEFEQGRPLIEQIKQQFPEKKVIVTFFSPSGYEVRKNYTGADVVCYLPFDTLSNVKRFLSIVTPEIAFFVKYEFWANYLKILHSKDIPTYLISGIFRDNQLFFRPYGSWYRKLLTYFDHFFVQNENSAQLLKSLNLHNVTVTGDTRFDRVAEIASAPKELPIIEAFATGHRVWVAGSSWPADEEILATYFNGHSDLKLIIAPHVISEQHIELICSKLKRKYVRYTQTTADEVAIADCLIIDTIGLLSSVYRYGEVAYIGGGFGVGIHNVLEAAVYSLPVIFGPNYHKFKEACDLITAGGAFAINNQTEFDVLADRLAQSEEVRTVGNIAGDYVNANRGATSKIIDHVF